jgi:hypothetical protein
LLDPPFLELPPFLLEPLQFRLDPPFLLEPYSHFLLEPFFRELPPFLLEPSHFRLDPPFVELPPFLLDPFWHLLLEPPFFELPLFLLEPHFSEPSFFELPPLFEPLWDPLSSSHGLLQGFHHIAPGTMRSSRRVILKRLACDML